MKFAQAVPAILALVSFSSLALSQDITGLPTCSLLCFQQAVGESGCGQKDTVCQCTTGADAIRASVTPCVKNTCSDSDLALIQPAVDNICAKALASAGISSTATAMASGRRSTAASASAAQTADASATGAAPASATSNAASSIRGRGYAGLGAAAAIGMFVV